MKTVKCFIECEYLEVPMIKKMQISQKEFEANLKHLLGEVERTADDECPVELFRDEIKEFETHTTRAVIFHSGCCATYLTKMTCKEGYRFK